MVMPQRLAASGKPGRLLQGATLELKVIPSAAERKPAAGCRQLCNAFPLAILVCM